jgi:hypothetical protein
MVNYNGKLLVLMNSEPPLSVTMDCSTLLINGIQHFRRHILCGDSYCFRYVLAKMEEDSEDDPHGHITSLAVKRSHR